MAAPAYPAWVTRWVSGQWRNKKRPPTLRPPRPLALADKVANRRERATGERWRRESRARRGAAAVPRKGPRCWQSSAAPWAPQGEREGAGLGRGIHAWVLWEGSLLHTAALSLRSIWVRHVAS